MERIEELLMDMIDDGPLDGSADASPLPIDAELRNELQRIHAQSPLLAQCIEYPSDTVMAALQAQRASLHATFFSAPTASVGAAGKWGGGVVVLATLLNLTASLFTPEHVLESIPRTPVVLEQPAVFDQPSVEQPAQRIREGVRSVPTSPRRITTSTIESRIERSALEQHRKDLLERLSRTTDPEERRQLERDLKRASEVVKEK
ncbi:MAG: hypothetical protein JSS89_09345 [Bacteroidetes bacterium]|nr:hypothetical protein [Bacteroidota bacterium]